MPELLTAYTSVSTANISHIAQHKFLLYNVTMTNILITLVVCLLRNTKQPTELADFIAVSALCVQTIYCLVPDFFRIGIRNVASAMSIILS